MIEIKSVQEFDTLLGQGPLVADFWAVWCAPCRALSPILEAVAKTHPEVQWVKVNIEVVPELASRYAVSALPTIKFFKDGLVTATALGVVSKVLLEQKLDSLY